MENTRTPLLDEIEAFLAVNGMSETYFGKKAAGNSELVARLRNGGDVTTKTAERVRVWIKAESKRHREWTRRITKGEKK